MKDEQLKFRVMMSPEVPLDAIVRGSANVGLTIFDARRNIVINRQAININNTFEFVLNCNETDGYRFEIDNNGNADTDWVYISVDA